MTLEEKYQLLTSMISESGGMLVAFSGGVDSTFLAKVAFDVLGERALAVTARAKVHAAFEEQEAVELAREIGIRHLVIDADPLEAEGFAQNPPQRCYICKSTILSALLPIARQEGLATVAEGSNASDTGDYRPGMRAVDDLGAVSPLKEAGLVKDEIRLLSRRLGLSTWDKPAFACLASRIPYGNIITEDKLRSVDAAEDYLRARGYRILRVRHHGDVARIELAPEEMERFMDSADLAEVARAFKGFGFRYAALDLEGYRIGSLNEALSSR